MEPRVIGTIFKGILVYASIALVKFVEFDELIKEEKNRLQKKST